MTIDELAGLRRREERRLAESAPFSPEWDAAKAAVDEYDDAMRARTDEEDGPVPPAEQAPAGAQRDES